MELSRRGFLGVSAGGFAQFALHHRFDLFVPHAKSIIVLWMDGGPSQIDTFDPRPGRPTGGEFRAVDTSAEGLKFSEHLWRTAAHAHRMAVLRTVTSQEQDHVRAGYLLHTGYRQSGMVIHPGLGSIVSAERGGREGVPGYVSIKSSQTIALGREPGPGFLGPEHAPFVIGDARRPDETLRALDPTVRERMSLLEDLNREFHADHSGENIDKRKTFHRLAKDLKDSVFARALDLRDESAETVARYLGENNGKKTDAYGRSVPSTQFGYGCLVARRLVESGVRFVEVGLGGWDTHADNFSQTASLCGMLDPAMSALFHDLERRGLLDETVVVWMGEFGRTPDINGGKGRDHWPTGFSVVLGGGGVQGGRSFGELDPDGKEIQKDPVRVQDLFATLCVLLGIDPDKRFLSHSTGTVRLTDHGVPVKSVYL
ncbi:MAG TPA: DUF1501 domain-containing protein [Planctomycetota bacterium]|nr:DUF1501 domain-containing protein [Planctomycetota bacterium]